MKEEFRRQHAWLAALLLVLAPSVSVLHAEESESEPATTPESTESEGIVAHLGAATASFRFFGDIGAGYDSSIDTSTGSKANFMVGTFDFFATARLTDSFQMLTEIGAEFEPDSNEVGFELERFWASWSKNDAFYVKLGREHSPVSHWNRRYHHGRIFWPAVTQPFVARFEDGGGPLPIHQAGVEVGGTAHTRAGAFGYAAVVSNGRGVESTEVTNLTDRTNSKAWDAGVSFAPSGAPGLLFGLNYHNDRIPSDPSDPLTQAMREGIATIFGELRAGRWEAMLEAVSIDHQTVSSGPDFQHYSGYLQVNCTFKRASPYARVDVRKMALGDRFYSPANLDLDRWDGIVGVRIDMGNQAAIKMEAGYGRSEVRDILSVVTKENVLFGGLSLQWFF